MTRCVVDGKPIVQPQTGRPRLTCSDACRKALSRRTRALWPERFEEAEEALVSLVASGIEAPEFALQRIVTAWRVAA